MRAIELISKMQKIVDEHGNVPVYFDYDQEVGFITFNSLDKCVELSEFDTCDDYDFDDHD